MEEFDELEIETQGSSCHLRNKSESHFLSLYLWMKIEHRVRFRATRFRIRSDWFLDRMVCFIREIEGWVIGAGNDIWIGERERIMHGIWFWSRWSITLPILLWPDYYFVSRFITGGDRKFLTVITKIKIRPSSFEMEIFHPVLAQPLIFIKSMKLLN